MLRIPDRCCKTHTLAVECYSPMGSRNMEARGAMRTLLLADLVPVMWVSHASAARKKENEDRRESTNNTTKSRPTKHAENLREK